MSFNFDPLNLFAIFLMQLANRYMKFDLTENQEKLMMHPFTQIAMYTSVIYLTTRNMPITLLVIFISYTCIYILFNEKHYLNLISPINKSDESAKEIYKNNVYKYHSLI
jgi:hypothetical protein